MNLRFQICVVLLSLCGLGVAAAQSGSERVLPPFMTQPLQGTGQAQVALVQSGPTLDVVVLSVGYNEGYEVGMLCEVSREGQPVASLILAEVTEDSAAGLILDLTDAAPIQTNDTVTRRVRNF
ncbi:MAG: hypothetical protein ACOCVG_04320 [Verrucomicrobiota bacterium]